MIKVSVTKKKPANTSFICKPINPKCMSNHLPYLTHMPTQYFPVPNEPRSTYQTGDSPSTKSPLTAVAQTFSSNLFTLPSLPFHGNPSKGCGLCFSLTLCLWLTSVLSHVALHSVLLLSWNVSHKFFQRQLSLHLSPHHTWLKEILGTNLTPWRYLISGHWKETLWGGFTENWVSILIW